MYWYASHIQNLDKPIQVIFYGILGLGFLAYWVWARPSLVKTQKALAHLSKALTNQQSLAQARAAAEPVVAANPILKDAWLATNKRVVAIGQGDRTHFVLLGSVDDLWQPERLLLKRFNFAMFEAIPNIAVGVGLLFTFIFLTLALTDATAALTAQNSQSTSILDATRSLLGSAGGKFLSSLAGLTVSLAWTFFGRRRLVRVQRAASQVVEAIEQILPPVGAEAAVAEQLEQLQTLGDRLASQQATLVKSQELLQDQQALTDDLLVEAREQTGSLKRFETDLAVTIGKTITNSFAPQMEQMTSRLVDAIAHLSDRIGTMNEDALQKMMQDFSQVIRSNTDAEMDKFKETLMSLSASLNDASKGLTTGVEDAAGHLGRATADMTEKLSAAAQGLVSSVQNMDAAMDKAQESVKQMDATIERAATLGAQGLSQVDRTLTNTEQVAQRMGEVGRHWTQAAETLERTAGRLAEVSDGMDELSQEQRAVVASVRSVAPEALQAVGRMSTLLDESARSAAQSMSTVQESMAKTSRDLGGVVSSITEGVGTYTEQVARLHQTMDAKMAEAVGKLGGAIQNLTETIDELNDGPDGFKPKA